MNSLSNSELKLKAKQQLRDNWLSAILVIVVIWIITNAFTSTNVQQNTVEYINVNGEIIKQYTQVSASHRIADLIALITSGPLLFGSAAYFLHLCREQNAKIEDVFYGFKHFGRTFLAYILTKIFTILWTLLLIIPGIIAVIKYSMVYYIMNDYPQISALNAIKCSKEMMYGHKGRLFGLWFSFIGWFLLGVITFGIGFLYVQPYYNATLANFYENLKDNIDDNMINKYLY